MSFKVFLVLALGLIGLGQVACGRDVTYGGRTWQLSPGCSLHGRFLTVDVPKDRWGDTQWARTSVDLSRYIRKGFEARVRVCTQNVAKPTEPWLGFKFMLRWQDQFTEAMHYPGANVPPGSSAWHQVAFRQTGDFFGSKGPGILHLGLQGTSGRVIFDLDSLEIGDLTPVWPMTNQTLRCSYTQDVVMRPMGRGVMSPSGRDMSEDDFRTLSDWGVTLLRYQMVRDWHGVDTNRDLDDFDRWLEGRLDHFERGVLPLARKYGVSVVLDMHVTPGGRDGAHESVLFHDRRFADHFVELWRRIARRFCGTEGIWAYDLMNEPQQQRVSDTGIDGWNLQRLAAEAIRTVDRRTPILIEGNANDSPDAYRNLSPLDMVNIIYEVHVYVPEDFTHQGIAGFSSGPNRWPDESHGWNRAYLRSILAPVRDFQLKHGARIYVGEFSSVCWASGADNYLRDCLSLFEEYDWDWTYHAFREWMGWSVEHEGTDAAHLHPSVDNPRKRVLLRALKSSSKVEGYAERNLTELNE